MNKNELRKIDTKIAKLLGMDIEPRSKHTWKELNVDETDRYQSTFICTMCNETPGWVGEDELDRYASKICVPSYPWYSKNIFSAFEAIEQIGWEYQLTKENNRYQFIIWKPEWITDNLYASVPCLGGDVEETIPLAICKAIIEAENEL